MDKVILIARIVLGLIFVVFGLNFFFHYLPNPELNEEAGRFFGALMETGYMFPVIKIVEIAAGAMILAGFMVPLALTLLAPIVVNIVLFHLVLDTAGLPIAILVLVLELFLAWAYRDAYRGMLTASAKPLA